MKKITLFFLFFIIILPTKNLIFAEENDYDFYKKSLERKLTLNNETVIVENESYKIDYQNKTGALKNFSRVSDIYKKNLTANLQSYSYGSNLLSNGNFELGHAYWNEWYKNSSGNWYDYDFIIQAGSGGYDNWYAHLSQNDWLISNYDTAPNNTVDFRVSYNYKLNYWGTCSYGTNGIGVYLEDKTLNSFYVINAHDAEIGPYDYNYTFTSFLVSSIASISPVSNHDVYIEFLHINDDPNCSLAFSLDNVSVEPVIYVPDYTISTSAGSNGSITSGITIAQGGNYIVNIAPNLGYEIADVLVDGVSVGPVKYYFFNNIFASHSVSATFQTLGSDYRVYRFWNNIDGRHFFTMSDNEMSEIINTLPEWNYEGVAYRAFQTQVANSTPLYRFWNKIYGQHFYTTSQVEKEDIIINLSNTWAYEDIAYYVYPDTYSGSSNFVFRFWNKINGRHFFTTSTIEKDDLIYNYAYIWKYEGLAWKVSN